MLAKLVTENYFLICFKLEIKQKGISNYSKVGCDVFCFEFRKLDARAAFNVIGSETVPDFGRSFGLSICII